MENAILTFTYGLTLGVTAIIVLQFILDEYYSLKKHKSWPTAESTQDEEDDQLPEKDDQSEGSKHIIRHEAGSDYSDHQYKDLIK